MYYQQSPQQGFYPQQQQFQPQGYNTYPTQPVYQQPGYSGYYQPQYNGVSAQEELSTAMVNLDTPVQQQAQPTAMMQPNGYYPQYASPPPPPIHTQPQYQGYPPQGYYPQQPAQSYPQQGGYNNQPMNAYQATRRQNPLFDYYKDAEKALGAAIQHDTQSRPNAMNTYAKLNFDRFGDQSDWFQRFSSVLGMLVYRDVNDYGNNPQSAIIKYTPVVYKALLADIATSQPQIEQSIPTHIRGQLNSVIQTYNKLQAEITAYGKQRVSPTQVHTPQPGYQPPPQTGDYSIFNDQEYEPPRMPGELTRSNMLLDLPDEEYSPVTNFADEPRYYKDTGTEDEEFDFYSAYRDNADTVSHVEPEPTPAPVVKNEVKVAKAPRKLRGTSTVTQSVTPPLKTNAETPCGIVSQVMESDADIYSPIGFDIDEHNSRQKQQTPFPSQQWKQNTTVPENQTDGMIVEEERHYGQGQPFNDFENDGDLRQGVNFNYGPDGVPYRLDVEGADVDYDENADSLFDEVMGQVDEVDQPPSHKPFKAMANSFSQAMANGFGSNLTAEMPNVTGLPKMNQQNEIKQLPEVENYGDVAVADIKTVFELGEDTVTDNVLMTDTYNRRIPIMPAFLAGKQQVVVVPTKTYNIIVARPIGNKVNYEQHELEWTEKHQIKSLQNTFDTDGNVEYGGNVLEEFSVNKTDLNELSDRVLEAATSEDPDDQHALEIFLSSTPTIVLDDVIASNNDQDLFTEPYARIHTVLGDTNEVDLDNMLVQYRRFVAVPYQIPATEIAMLRGLQLATEAGDIVERIEEFQQATAIPERAIARLNKEATTWVQRLIQTEFDPKWELDSLTLDFDDLCVAVEEVYGEAGVKRLNDIYVRAVQNTYTHWDKMATDALDTNVTDALGLSGDDTVGMIGHVEHITLLPFDYNDYPLAFIGDVGIIDPTALPQLYGMLTRTIEAQKFHVTEYKFVTKDNAVYKFFKTVAGDEILIARN